MPNNRRPFLATRLFGYVCIASSSLGPFASRAQTLSDKNVQMAVVQLALKDAEQGSYNGIMVKALGRIGDATAVALTKILADKPISDADIPPILLVVRLSQGSLEGVEETTDRNPSTTLYLLHSLSQAAKDPKIVASVEETTAYVKSQRATYLQRHPNE